MNLINWKIYSFGRMASSISEDLQMTYFNVSNG